MTMMGAVALAAMVPVLEEVRAPTKTAPSVPVGISAIALTPPTAPAPAAPLVAVAEPRRVPADVVPDRMFTVTDAVVASPVTLGIATSISAHGVVRTPTEGGLPPTVNWATCDSAVVSDTGAVTATVVLSTWAIGR